jgi:hypothetical protein
MFPVSWLFASVLLLILWAAALPDRRPWTWVLRKVFSPNRCWFHGLPLRLRRAVIPLVRVRAWLLLVG